MYDTLLQIPGEGPGCYASGIDPGCFLSPFTASMGATFVLFVAFAVGGAMSIYHRSPAPLTVVSVLVGGAAVTVLPALANRLIVLLAIAASAAALFTFYRRLR
jgi:hypothetical protein